MARLSRQFYSGDTVEIAQNLLGRYLVRVWNGIPLVCRIVETEAYVGRMDKAYHAYGYRRTARTETLFGPPGHAYIYLIYGMYHCLNFVTEPEGEPSAVLLRGLESVGHTEEMAQLRFGKPLADLAPCQQKNFLNGPGKCCKALSLDRYLNGVDLLGDTLYLCTSPTDAGLPDVSEAPRTIRTGRRIGIDYAEEAVEFPWRFWLEKKG
ncbi:MAG: DNA-3-methyladenine glycosylase [Oscillibacter sp.]|nr:DNA-3-methyladenine glycosylase [Oscillibacter sp.]